MNHAEAVFPAESIPYVDTLSYEPTYAFFQQEQLRTPLQRTAHSATRSPAQEYLNGRNALMMQAARAAAKEELSSGGKVSPVESDVRQLLTSLPTFVPVADEVYVLASGSICFDWDENKDVQLSIMLQGKRIAFAAYFDGDTVHGSSDFSTAVLSQELLAAAKKWASRSRR